MGVKISKLTLQAVNGPEAANLLASKLTQQVIWYEQTFYAQVSKLTLQTIWGPTPDQTQISKLTMQGLWYQDNTPMQVGKVTLQVVWGGEPDTPEEPGVLRMTKITLQNVWHEQLPVELDRLEASRIYEWNPYRADVGYAIKDVNDELTNFLLETIHILREQHNLIQVGDSTVPWELTKELQKEEKMFTLGSLGRFVHPTYGLIYCRYVQFNQVWPDGWSGAPVGYANTNKKFAWQATQRFDNSSENDLIGLCASYTTPEHEDYGWVIVNGVNTQGVLYVGAFAPEVGMRLQWTGQDTVGPAQDGAILGTVVSVEGLEREYDVDSAWQIRPGCIRIETLSGGVSADGETPELTPEQLAEIQANVIAAINLASILAQITSVSNTVTSLGNQITNEVTLRGQGDAALQVQINELATQADEIQDALDVFALTANETLVSLQSQINTINATLPGQITALDVLLAAQIARIDANEFAIQGLQFIASDPGSTFDLESRLNWGWENFDAGYETATLRRMSNRHVYMTGTVADPTLGGSSVLAICNLPPLYRPDTIQEFLIPTGFGVAKLTIKPDGDVDVENADETQTTFNCHWVATETPEEAPIQWRLRSDDTSDASEYLSIAEWGIYESVNGPNLILGATMSASADDGAGFEPEEAIDENAATFWATGANAPPAEGHWIEALLTRGVTPKRFMVQARPDATRQEPVDIYFEYSLDGGSNWDLYASVLGEAAWAAGEIRYYTVP